MTRSKFFSRTILVSLTLFLLFNLTLFASASSNVSLASKPQTTPAAGSLTLSTPQLLDQALAKGEITAEQRLLYLSYAIYEYSSLPQQFRSDAGWFGTEYLREVKDAWKATSVDQKHLSEPTLHELRRVLASAAATICDQEDGPYTDTVSANFYINYGTISGTLTLAQYRQTLDDAFATEVTSYGWAKPPISHSPPDGKYPVQIVPLIPGLYGYVTTGGAYGGWIVGDNPNTPEIETASTTSCMVLRSDSYATLGGLSGLRVTSAHEFKHAIQNGYGDPAPDEDLMWWEGDATYTEDEVWDAINDNYQYLWPDWTQCLGEWPSGAEYSIWLLFRYAAEHNGGVNTAGGGEDVVQGVWQNIAAGQSGLNALNTALGNKTPGATLADTFHKYAIASRFMKTCPTASPYCYEEAAGYTAAAGAINNNDNIGAVGQSYSGNLQDNYAINWIGLPTEGSYNVVFENTSADGQFRISVVADTASGLQVTPLPSLVGGNNRSILEGYKPPTGATSVVAVITNQSQTADDPASCTSNPYKLSVAPIVAFVIDDTGSMWEEINDVKTVVTQKVDEFVAKGVFPTYHLLTFKDDVNYRGKTADASIIKSWVNALYASGGGDCPEEMLGALNRIAQEAPYSEAWAMTDAGFHGGPGDVAITIYNLIRAHVKVHPIIYSWCFDAASGAKSDQTCARADIGVTSLDAVGPESFAQIASETGGHYFQISSSETQAATSILLNEMVTNSDLTVYSNMVSSGSIVTYTVLVDFSTGQVNFLLNTLNGHTDLSLFNPNGVLVNPGDPGVVYTGLSNAEYYQITNPLTGTWRAQISGNGTFAFSASGDSPISLAYLSDTSLPKGQAVTLLARLSGPIASTSFQFTYPDGTVLNTVPMFDDGTHGDGAADDGVFGGTYTPLIPGSFYFRVKGTTTDGALFERVATEIIRVQSLSVTASPGQTALPGATVTYLFSIANGGTQPDTFNLTVSSSKGWIDPSSLPPTLAIAANATAQVTVTVNVPLDAALNSIDETTLVAISQANPLVNDAATVVTTVSNSSHTLSVNKTGTGQGTVTSNPAGIDCGVTCSASFGSNTSVTLTATPATTSTFTGWSGACTGAGSCVVAMTADQSVTATFTLLCPNTSGTYCRTDTDPRAWIAGTTNQNITADNTTKAVALPFTFRFMGTDYTSLNISSNGNVHFGAASSAYANVAIPNTGLPNALIAAFWDDLSPNLGGAIYTGVSGTPPNRTFVIEWRNVSHYALSRTDGATFEIQLDETTNHIYMVYQDTTFGSTSYNNAVSATSGASATSGVENAAGTVGNQYSFNSPVLTAGKVLHFWPQ